MDIQEESESGKRGITNLRNHNIHVKKSDIIGLVVKRVGITENCEKLDS